MKNLLQEPLESTCSAPRFLHIPLLLLIVTIVAASFLNHRDGLSHPYDIDKMAVALVTRQVQQGKSITLKGDIYYQRNGNMVTHFTFPREYMVIGNKFGETKIYDPANNTVAQYQNFLFSTQSSQFYYFFTGKTADMGLTHIGYVPDKTYTDNNLLVTEWKLKSKDKNALIQRIKVVHQGGQPIYMHYQDGSGKIIRKVYYYNYQLLETYSFPSATTEILYDKGDSVVSKTSYFNFKLNNEATGSYFNFVIPSNAKTAR